MSVLHRTIKQGGGVIAGPQGLGILVGSDPIQTPPGWLFVDASEAANWDKQQCQLVLAQLRSGRAVWPEQDGPFLKPFARNAK